MHETPDALATWLRGVGQQVTGQVTIRRIGFGQSNITCAVVDEAGAQWVLRQPPLGRRSASAHDVLREARIMRALQDSPIPVPTVIGTGEGADGHPFVVMNRVPGAPLETEAEAAELTPDARRELGLQVIGVFAALHRLDPVDVGLQDLGPRDGYVQRQMRRIGEAWQQFGTGSRHHGAWDDVRGGLEVDPPAPSSPSIVHGDYRLANLMVHDGRVSAVLDWELSTIGEPLADLAWLLDDWKPPSEPANTMPSPTRAGAFPDRDELLERYSQASGIDVARIDYYRGFSQWRAASLLQGVHVRRSSGSMGSHGDLDLDSLDLTIERLLASAGQHLERDRT